MTSTILLMLFLIIVRRCIPVSSCPASCMVCSDNAVICHRLAYIIDAPDTTEALLLTQGSIAAVQSAPLSVLSNITVIGLSHNRISVMAELSFRNLPFLHTLLLDHNLLTSQALQDDALSNLSHLQVLALGHNLISQIQADWFKGTTALRTLNLEGNRITSLDPGSLPLHDLENLDLSDNLIQSLDINSFHGLVHLRNLDISRNRLSSAPSQAFSYLSWLTNLNLDLNSWNCSCQLLDLAAFLSAFIQQPDKTLYNGRKMVCVSVDNPAVTTVLELTDANCVPSNQNITVQIETRASVTPQVYARDLAITAVLCFVGGIGLTLLVVLICYQVSRRQKRKEIPKQRDPEEGSGPVSNFTAKHHEVAEKPRELFLQAHQLLDNESIPWDSRTENYRSQVHNRVSSIEDEAYFMCPDCKVQGLKLNRWDNRMNGVMEKAHEGDRRLSQRDILGRDIPHNVLSRDSCRSSSHQRKHHFIPTPEALAAFYANNEMRAETRHPAILHCNSCNRTFNMNESKNHPHVRDTSVSHISNRRRISDYDRFDAMNNQNIPKQRRNVTFNTERRDQGKSRRTDAAKKPRNMARGTEKNHKGKLHLPFGKTKVHPKRKPEQDRRNSKRKKDRKQSEGKESSGEQSKRSSKKASERDDGEEKKDGGKDQKVSRLSLQEENLVINTTTSAGGSLVPPAPKMVGRRSMSLSGASNSLQEGFLSPGTPLLANAENANSLQTTPLHASLPGGLEPNSSLNPILSQSPLDSSTLEPRVKSDPRLDEGFCTGDRQSPLASELPITASQSLDGFKSENGTATDGLLDSKCVAGRPEMEVQAVSGVSTLAADVFPEGASAQSTSSSGSAKATSPLLQQEYLEEESGSSSRRKLRLVLPEKTSSREPTALEKKIR